MVRRIAMLATAATFAVGAFAAPAQAGCAGDSLGNNGPVYAYDDDADGLVDWIYAESNAEFGGQRGQNGAFVSPASAVDPCPGDGTADSLLY